MNIYDERGTARLVVLLPAYNEADSIEPVLAEVQEMAIRLSHIDVRTSVIVIDDGSPDGTADLARAFGERFDLAVRIEPGPRCGLGAAMLRGLAAALEEDPDAIVTLDADGQHNPDDIPTLFRAFRARRADILVGSRWTRGGRSPGTTVARGLGSRLGNVVFRAITGTRGVADATTSFRVYSPRVARFLLGSDSQRFTGYSFFSTTIALAEAAGFVISEVPIEFRPRFGGVSKLNRQEARRYFTTLPTLRGERRRAMGSAETAEYLATQEMAWLDAAVAWNEFMVECTLGTIDHAQVTTVLEVGAGVGAITTQLLDRFPNAHVYALEPDARNGERLSERFANNDRVTVAIGTIDSHSHILPKLGVDLAVYINVLEHIERDVDELIQARDVVVPGGRVAIFVPGMPELYGPIDARSGHHRRYTVETLEQTVRAAGFEVERTGNADRLGVLPYWIQYRLLNKAGMPSTSPRLFNKVFVPASRFTDSLVSPKLPGKNVACVGRRAAMVERQVGHSVSSTEPIA